jgi:hypothetical protein
MHVNSLKILFLCVWCVAVRLRSIIGRVGLAHWAAGTTSGSASEAQVYGSSNSESLVYGLLDEIGKMCALATMANEAVMGKVYW